MLHVNWLMGGIVIVEVVFGYPGLGAYLLDQRGDDLLHHPDALGQGDQVRDPQRGHGDRAPDAAQGLHDEVIGQSPSQGPQAGALGLAGDPALAAAAGAVLDVFGTGASASRLISGNTAYHEALERRAAAFLGRERALLFPSGFQANTGAIPVLAERGGRDADGPALVLSDARNHASLIHGIRLCRAERRIFPHNDTAALRHLLEKAPEGARILVVTESLFSMDGDRAPLREMAALKAVRPFLFYVDEAHALGACGPGGRGLVEEAGVSGSVDVVLGTLGKSLGTAGAFLAARAEVVELLLNRARTFIYTTAPPPALAAAAGAALDRAAGAEDRRARLRENSARFRAYLAGVLGAPPPGQDHIVPVAVPGAERVMAVSRALLARGVFCQGIRPPTVPPGGCRLRFSVSALHEDAHLARTAEALAGALEEAGAGGVRGGGARGPGKEGNPEKTT